MHQFLGENTIIYVQEIRLHVLGNLVKKSISIKNNSEEEEVSKSRIVASTFSQEIQAKIEFLSFES